MEALKRTKSRPNFSQKIQCDLSRKVTDIFVTSFFIMYSVISGPDETIYRSSDDKRIATIEWRFFGDAQIGYNSETFNNDVHLAVQDYVLEHWDERPPGEDKKILEAELQQYLEEHPPILIDTEDDGK